MLSFNRHTVAINNIFKICFGKSLGFGVNSLCIHSYFILYFNVDYRLTSVLLLNELRRGPGQEYCLVEHGSGELLQMIV